MFPSKQLAVVELCILVMYFIFHVLKHEEKVSIFLDTSLFTLKVLIYFDFKNDIEAKAKTWLQDFCDMYLQYTLCENS